MAAALVVARGIAFVIAVLLVVALAARRVSPAPDLVLVLVVAWSLVRGPVAGAATGLAAGWVLDLVPPGSTTPGLTALAYAAAGALAGRAWSLGPVAASRVGLTTVAAAVVVQGVAVARAWAMNAPVDLRGVGLGCLLTTMVAVVVVPLVVRAERGLARRRYA